MIAVINGCLKCDSHTVHMPGSRFQRVVQRKNEIPERRRAWLILGRICVIHIAHLGIPIFSRYVPSSAWPNNSGWSLLYS